MCQRSGMLVAHGGACRIAENLGAEKFNAWFKNRIIGGTPVHDLGLNAEYGRFHEITDFMKSREWLNVPWIAIDDKRSHFPVDSPAYITDATVGITSKDAENIILIGKSMRFAQHALLEHMSRRGTIRNQAGQN